MKSSWGKINSQITNIILNIRHWYMLEMNLLNSVNGNVIQSQAQWKVSKNQEKWKKVIQRMYNLMNLNDDSMVVIIKNNITAQVMNETDI